VIRKIGMKHGISYHGVEHRERVCRSRALRKIFAPTGEEVTGGRRKEHNGLHSLPKLFPLTK
jgi:hypothetical protein